MNALDKTKFLVQFRIVRDQVPPSGEETGQNYIVTIDIHLHGAAPKRDTSWIITNPYPHSKAKKPLKVLGRIFSKTSSELLAILATFSGVSSDI
ncbi:hypothetical protein TNCV_3599741 [Trichonephila clavipes]|nr:hypothetical protein TNCV_3599741 [Trichonephila clavipes]